MSKEDELVELARPATEIEISTFLMNITINPQAKMLVRRMAFELNALRAERDKHADAQTRCD